MRPFLLLAALAMATPALAQDAPAADSLDDPQTEHAFADEVTMPVAASYLLYLPDDYGTSDEPWPLLLFLHGAGERGDSLGLVKKNGPPKHLAEGEDFPFIVVSPQAPEREWWNPYVLDALLDEVIATHRVDEDRVYVTGLSMGGFGTWSLITLDPDRFAAAAPVCGGGDPEAICGIGDLPVWAFHGEEDSIVPVERTVEMVQALEACGGDVRATIYPGVDHDSWTETYDNPDLYDWLLAHRRSDRE